MKKAIYISGIVAVNLLLMGALMKILHWPGANIMLILAIAAFVFWFIPASLINHFKSLDKPANPTLHIMVFVVCLINFVGALFKILHWPGASWFLIIGIPAPFVLFLPVYIIRYNKQKHNIDGNFFAVMFLFVYIAVISVFLALQVGKEIMNYGIIIGDNIQITYSNLDSLSSYRAEIHSHEIHKKTDELCKDIDNLKTELVKFTQKDVSEIVKDNGEIDLWKLNGRDTRDASKIYFSEEYGSDNLGNFLREVKDYREYLIGFIPEQQKHKRDFVNEALSTSNILYEPDRQIDLPGINLANTSLMMVINHLTYLQTNIRLAELQVI